ncbi:hypothetical protein BDN70DRAFT_439442 [Pholiota conissans]|uniref:Uncharacterized protein n=1 Tax=Pholiota conissans TaxID=109636 RepID=A0A9P5YSA5_9AGAR|nr:hypothetical protein BDN70DRAFT_439442 [Pholiota conissans]
MCTTPYIFWLVTMHRLSGSPQARPLPVHDTRLNQGIALDLSIVFVRLCRICVLSFPMFSVVDLRAPINPNCISLPQLSPISFSYRGIALRSASYQFILSTSVLLTSTARIFGTICHVIGAVAIPRFQSVFALAVMYICRHKG